MDYLEKRKTITAQYYSELLNRLDAAIQGILHAGHGCFNAYLKRFKKRDDESCRYCGSLVENAEHTLFVCARWGAKRKTVGRVVGAQLIPDTMISLMLQSEQIWMLIESFVTLVTFHSSCTLTPAHQPIYNTFTLTLFFHL